VCSSSFACLLTLSAQLDAVGRFEKLKKKGRISKTIRTCTRYSYYWYSSKTQKMKEQCQATRKRPAHAAGPAGLGSRGPLPGDSSALSAHSQHGSTIFPRNFRTGPPVASADWCVLRETLHAPLAVLDSSTAHARRALRPYARTAAGSEPVHVFYLLVWWDSCAVRDRYQMSSGHHSPWVGRFAA
jgi:hypothetical protein